MYNFFIKVIQLILNIFVFEMIFSILTVSVVKGTQILIYIFSLVIKIRLKRKMYAPSN